jgi:hypothetical protein
LGGAEEGLKKVTKVKRVTMLQWKRFGIGQVNFLAFHET